jgi:hypothetical protein
MRVSLSNLRTQGLRGAVLHVIHETGSVVGTLTALVGLVSDLAHLMPPETAVKVSTAGAVLAGVGKAIPILERAVAGEVAS